MYKEISYSDLLHKVNKFQLMFYYESVTCYSEFPEIAKNFQRPLGFIIRSVFTVLAHNAMY